MAGEQGEVTTEVIVETPVVAEGSEVLSSQEQPAPTPKPLESKPADHATINRLIEGIRKL